MGLAHEDADDGGDDDADEDGALDTVGNQNGGDDQTDEGQQRGALGDGAHIGVGAGGAGTEGGNNVDVKHADEGNEEADTGGDGRLERGGDGSNDLAAQRGHGDDEKQHAGNKYDSQGLLPGVAHAEAYGEGEEGIEAHAGCLAKGNIGQESGEQAADRSGNTGGDHNAGVVHAGLGQVIGVNKNNVRHGKEGGDTGQNFGLDIGTVGFELKQLFHFVAPL